MTETLRVTGWLTSDEGPTLLDLVRQGLCSIEEGYDRLAPQFDRTVFRTPALALDALEAHFPPCRSALDIGCGTGAALERLLSLTDDVCGVDLSRNMLAVARQRLGPRPALWHADFLRCRWEERFDLITCVGMLGHVHPAQQDEFFARVSSALRPDGIFLTLAADVRGQPWKLVPGLVFDALMKLRNLVWRPTFVMYYLSFLLPGALAVPQRHGLECQVLPANLPPPFDSLCVLRARKPGRRGVFTGSGGI